MSKRKIIFNVVDDLVSCFLYYDRKEDDELMIGDIEKCISDGDISKEEISAFFEARLIEYLSD